MKKFSKCLACGNTIEPKILQNFLNQTDWECMCGFQWCVGKDGEMEYRLGWLSFWIDIPDGCLLAIHEIEV